MTSVAYDRTAVDLYGMVDTSDPVPRVPASAISPDAARFGYCFPFDDRAVDVGEGNLLPAPEAVDEVWFAGLVSSLRLRGLHARLRYDLAVGWTW